MLPRLVPQNVAKRMIYFGERLNTLQAEKAGLVDFVVEDYATGLEEMLGITDRLNSQVRVIELRVWVFIWRKINV
jgi:enoyl-CoA hydratase/carnithine racemase